MITILYKGFDKIVEIKENNINYFLMIQSSYPTHLIFTQWLTGIPWMTF